MTAAEYKAVRKHLGTQAEVAALIGVHRVTLAKWETGSPIPPMAVLAIKALKPRKAKKRN